MCCVHLTKSSKVVKDPLFRDLALGLLTIIQSFIVMCFHKLIESALHHTYICVGEAARLYALPRLHMQYLNKRDQPWNLWEIYFIRSKVDIKWVAFIHLQVGSIDLTFLRTWTKKYRQLFIIIILLFLDVIFTIIILLLDRVTSSSIFLHPCRLWE